MNRCRCASSRFCIRSMRSMRARWAIRRAASSPNTDSRSLDPTTPEPPAMPISSPVSPPVAENTATISSTAAALTPSESTRARWRLPAPSARIVSRIPCCQARICSATCVSNVLCSVCTCSAVTPASCSSRRSAPGRSDPHERRTCSAARAAASTATACSPCSNACSTFAAWAGVPRMIPTSRSRRRPIPDSSERKNSPVPTKSCQRISTSPRSSVPSEAASRMFSNAVS